MFYARKATGMFLVLIMEAAKSKYMLFQELLIFYVRVNMVTFSDKNDKIMDNERE